MPCHGAEKQCGSAVELTVNQVHLLVVTRCGERRR